MRNMLAFFAALVLTFLAVGWYLNWYQVRKTPAPDGQRSVTVDINTRKIGQDLQKVEQKLEERLQKKISERAASERAAGDSSSPRTDNAAPKVTGKLPTPRLDVVVE